MCIGGLIGNILNICVFTSWTCVRPNCQRYRRSNRTSNCSLYLLIASWANLLVIIYPLSTRILFDGYNYSLRREDGIVFCKVRYFVLHTCDLISLACVCLATFDRYLISSRKARLRTLNRTRSQAFILLLVIIVLIHVHNLPVAFYYDVSIQGQCTIPSSFFASYYLYVFQIMLHSVIPIIFLSIFGTLTLRQLRSIGHAHRRTTRCHDKQLARMLVLISIAIILSSIPYCIEQLYYDLILMEKSPPYSSHVFFYHVISSILFYTNPVTSFYIFCISSRNFRCQVRKLLCITHLREKLLRSSPARK